MNALNYHSARFWSPDRDATVCCQLCPRHCRIKEGQRGFCFGRKNVDGKLVLTTYGRASGFCVDPIEKKPLYHFLPGTGVLSFGAIGCNLHCEFCQNWEISRGCSEAGLLDPVTPSAIAQCARRLGCQSVAFTYNEPIVSTEFVLDEAAACREMGIKTVAVSAGYISAEARAEFWTAMDAANVDLKSFSPDFYQRYCHAQLDAVLDNLIFIKKETNVWLELTTLLILGLNDSVEELQALTKWVVTELGPEVPLHFSAFHPDYKMQDRSPTPKETLWQAQRIARQNGLKHVYTGNVQDPAGSATHCSACGETLIERDGFAVKQFRLRDSRCPRCATVCAGYFDQAAGTWGGRRQSVYIPPG